MDHLTQDILKKNESFLDQNSADIQANIFSSPRCKHQLLLFLNFSGNSSERHRLIQTLQTLAGQTTRGLEEPDETWTIRLTSVADQYRRGRRKNKDQALFCNLYLTAAGLKVLAPKENEAAWKTIIDHLESKREDLQNRGGWNEEYQNDKKIHAVLLLGHPLKGALQRVRAQLTNDHFKEINVRCLFEEWGIVYRRRFFPEQRHGFTVEHFGYADGISKPWITRKDAEPGGRRKQADRSWRPIAAVEGFLVSESTGQAASENKDDAGPWGSYLVYRKYQQHVDRFAHAIDILAKKRGITQEEAGALAIGRHQDGTPLGQKPGSQARRELNDFVFPAEANGCPLSAHVRKMNGRDYPPDEPAKQLQYPIMRRGVTFGERPVLYNGAFDPSRMPQTPVGLLFLSFQQDIDYFHRLLERARTEPPDPLLGHLGQSGEQEPFEGLFDFISLLGGLNLYAPSLSFFRDLPNEEEPISRTLENSNPMPGFQPPIPLFGQDKLSWLHVIKYYNDYKVGYDGAIIALEQGYQVPLPKDRGNVEIRHQISLRSPLAAMPNLTGTGPAPTSFQFEVPIRRGFQAQISIVLTTWDEQEVLGKAEMHARYHDHEDKSEKILADDDDQFGYFQIELNRDENTSTAPGDSIVDRVKYWYEKGPVPVTNRLFLLRVKQIVWPSKDKKTEKDLELKDVDMSMVDCRDDSIILVFGENDPGKNPA